MAEALSFKALCEELGITARTWRRWREKGAPCVSARKADPAAVGKWAAENGMSDPLRSDDLSRALGEARLAKLQADAELTEMRRRLKEGELVEAADVLSDERRRVAAVRDGLLSLSAVLPPRLVGRSQDEIRDVIRRTVIRLLENYARGREPQEGVSEAADGPSGEIPTQSTT